jgi:hypothetical protein
VALVAMPLPAAPAVGTQPIRHQPGRIGAGDPVHGGGVAADESGVLQMRLADA